MKQALLVFRKDVHHLWQELGVYLLLLAAYAVAAPQVWPGKTPIGLLAVFVTLLKVLMAASWLVLITRAVHADSLVGDEQFWITRPYRWTSLLGGKLLFVAVCVAMPFVLMQWALILEAGLNPLSAKAALLESIVRFALNPMLTMFVVACVTDGLASAFTFLVGIIIAWAGLLTFALSGIEMRTSPPYDRPIMSVLFGGLMIGIVIYQYARRRTMQSRLAIGGTLVLFLLLMVGFDRAGFGAPVKAMIRHHYAEISSLRLVWTESVPYEERGPDMRIPGGMVEMKLPVQIEGMASDAKLRDAHVEVEMEAGAMRYAPAWQDAVLSEHAVGFLVPKDVFRRYAAGDTKVHLEVVAEELLPARDVKRVVADHFQGPMGGVCLLVEGKVYCRYPYEEVIPTRVEVSACGGPATSLTLRYMPVGGKFDPVVNEMLPIRGNICAGDSIRFTEYGVVSEFRIALDEPSVRIDQYRVQ
ncbi:MAG TPA: hypothetical protein VGN16_15650 [Acidobacteriaceae bacterium]|jgi:hypothetical protein